MQGCQHRFPGHELKLEGRKMAGNYLRVGLFDDGTWRTFKLRQDFNPTDKVQMEDDITASVVVPTDWLPDCGVGPERHPSVRKYSVHSQTSSNTEHFMR